MSEDQKIPNQWTEREGMEHNIFVTPRPFDVVYRRLRLPEGYFSSEVKVLSIGEGLSDFSKILHQKNGVNIIAMDPIYQLGTQILQSDPEEVDNILKQAYDGKVRLNTFFAKTIPLPNPHRILAASIYHLPFFKQSFDRIVTYRVLEHIDFGQALPELIQVLRPGGEIRMGGTVFEANPTLQELYLTYTMRDDSSKSDQAALSKMPNRGNLEGSLTWIKDHPEINMYAVITGHHQEYGSTKQFGRYQVGTIIIRADNQLPEVKSYDFDQNEEVANAVYTYGDLPFDSGYPKVLIDAIRAELKNDKNLGKVYKINPSPRHSDHEDEICFSLQSTVASD